MADTDECECSHTYDEHDRGGPCGAIDSLRYLEDGTVYVNAPCFCVHFEFAWSEDAG